MSIWYLPELVSARGNAIYMIIRSTTSTELSAGSKHERECVQHIAFEDLLESAVRTCPLRQYIFEYDLNPRDEMPSQRHANINMTPRRS